ncbi:MAG: DUF2892 domain-containing protein [Nitrospira sp.]
MPTNLSGPVQYQTNIPDLEWQEKRAEFDEHRENLSETERVLSAISGMLLLVRGLSGRNWARSVLAIAGGGLLYRAIGGYCPAYGEPWVSIRAAPHGPASRTIPIDWGDARWIRTVRRKFNKRWRAIGRLQRSIGFGGH